MSVTHDKGPLHVASLAVAELVPEWVTERFIASRESGTVFVGLATEEFRVSKILYTDHDFVRRVKWVVEGAVRELDEVREGRDDR